MVPQCILNAPAVPLASSLPAAPRVSVSYRYKSLRRASFNTRAVRINHNYLKSIRKHTIWILYICPECRRSTWKQQIFIIIVVFHAFKPTDTAGEQKRQKRKAPKKRLVMHCISPVAFSLVSFCFLLLFLVCCLCCCYSYYLLLLLLSSHCSHWLWQFLISISIGIANALRRSCRAKRLPSWIFSAFQKKLSDALGKKI